MNFYDSPIQFVLLPFYNVVDHVNNLPLIKSLTAYHADKSRLIRGIMSKRRYCYHSSAGSWLHYFLSIIYPIVTDNWRGSALYSHKSSLFSPYATSGPVWTPQTSLCSTLFEVRSSFITGTPPTHHSDHSAFRLLRNPCIYIVISCLFILLNSNSYLSVMYISEWIK